MSALPHVTESAFEKTVIQAKEPVLVDFYAEWCGPCKALGPILEKLAEEFSTRARIVKVNVDEEPGLAARFGIRGVPTLILFKDGRQLEAIVGLQPPKVLKAKLEQAAAQAPAA